MCAQWLTARPAHTCTTYCTLRHIPKVLWESRRRHAVAYERTGGETCQCHHGQMNGRAASQQVTADLSISDLKRCATCRHEAIDLSRTRNARRSRCSYAGYGSRTKWTTSMHPHLAEAALHGLGILIISSSVLQACAGSHSGSWCSWWCLPK